MTEQATADKTDAHASPPLIQDKQQPWVASTLVVQDFQASRPEEQSTPMSPGAADDSAQVPEDKDAEKEVPAKATENVPPPVLKENSTHKLTVVTSSAPITGVGPSERQPSSQHLPPPSERNSGSMVYGEEFLSVEEELQYPNPREQLPIFLDGAGAKGPLFNRNDYLEGFSFFQTSPYTGP